MRSTIRRAILPMLMCGLTASGCGERVEPLPNYPSAQDVEAGQEAKPEPTPAILTDPVAAADYDAAIESWGDRVHDAFVRACRSLKAAGAPYAFACGETSAERAARLTR